MEALAPIQHDTNAELIGVADLIVAELRSNLPLMKEAADYVSARPGKMIRARLTLETTRALIASINPNARAMAAVIEMLHLATLCHDDVLDGDTLRRGRGSLHAVFGLATGILTGDYIVCRALNLAATAGSLPQIATISGGLAATLEGEVAQHGVKRQLDLTRELHLQLIRRKTGALMGAACRTGALAAEVEPELVEQMQRFGEYFGTAFQLADDLLDYAGDKQKMGKTLGKDFSDGIPTLPLMITWQRADAGTREWLETGFGAGAPSDETLDELVDVMVRHGAIEDAKKEIRRTADEARACLRDVPYSAALENLLDESLNRQN